MSAILQRSPTLWQPTNMLRNVSLGNQDPPCHLISSLTIHSLRHLLRSCLICCFGSRSPPLTGPPPPSSASRPRVVPAASHIAAARSVGQPWIGQLSHCCPRGCWEIVWARRSRAEGSRAPRPLRGWLVGCERSVGLMDGEVNDYRAVDCACGQACNKPKCFAMWWLT
ncbi:uncharacterized protein BKA78DRAFT_159553 [Phyllosticta capitalensis]|uniref:uncharacterized protein n=1 Tax=Phyllosticta capitalensis TaxID=121624 RepID=UPI00312F1BCC